MKTLQRGNLEKLKLLTQVFSCFNYFSIVSRGGIFIPPLGLFAGKIKLRGKRNESYDSSPTK